MKQHGSPILKIRARKADKPELMSNGKKRLYNLAKKVGVGGCS